MANAVTAVPLLWPSCGYRLLARDTDSRLLVTDDFLRHLLAAPEIAPIAESCSSELDLHESLLASPRMAVDAERLGRLKDVDAAENYAIWLRFRDRLLAQPTLESAYLAFFQGTGVDVPPALLANVTQVLLCHVVTQMTSPKAQGSVAVQAFWEQLAAGHAAATKQQVTAGDRSDHLHPALLARAAEMLYRAQKISIQTDGKESAAPGGQVMAADNDTVERHASTGGFGSLGELLRQGGAPLRTLDLDVLSDANADAYWEGAERHDWVVSLSHGQPALAALCRVLEAWVAHFLGVAVRIEPAGEIDDERWVWHVGLDAQASAVLNASFQNQHVADADMNRMLCLFTCEFADVNDARLEVRGYPVYLAMAMDAQSRLKLKPQNLLLNLPLAAAN